MKELIKTKEEIEKAQRKKDLKDYTEVHKRLQYIIFNEMENRSRLQTPPIETYNQLKKDLIKFIDWATNKKIWKYKQIG